MAEGEFVPRLETGPIGAAFENSHSRGVSYGFGSTTEEEEEGRREREGWNALSINFSAAPLWIKEAAPKTALPLPPTKWVYIKRENERGKSY